MIESAKLILALDVGDRKKAISWVKLLFPRIDIFKVGLQLYTACGPGIIEDIRKSGAEVFLDLKLNDIPNTMAGAAREILKYGASMFTVHTLSGPTALKEVADVCKESKTKVLGVTILTSIGAQFLKKLKVQRSLPGEVFYLAKMAKDCGLDGVVCSVQEAGLLRKKLGKDFLLVTPGIRLAGGSRQDQERIATPKTAVEAGSNFLVVGRPILEARDPLKVVENILN